MKRIILEYSSLPLFWSFNGGNEKSIFLFGTLKWERMKWVRGNIYSSLFTQEPQIFILLKLGGIRIIFNEFSNKNPNTPIYSIHYFKIGAY